jgi:hypothetical protein
MSEVPYLASNMISKLGRKGWSGAYMLHKATKPATSATVIVKTWGNTELEFLPGAKSGISKDIEVGCFDSLGSANNDTVAWCFEPNLGVSVGKYLGGSARLLFACAQEGAANSNMYVKDLDNSPGDVDHA